MSPPPDGLGLAFRGQLEGIGTQAASLGQGRHGRDTGRRGVPAGRGSGRARGAGPDRATGCSAGSVAPRARSATGSSMAARISTRRSWSTTRCWSGSSGWCPWRRCTSRTIWRRSARSARASRRSPRSRASTPRSIAAIPRSPTAIAIADELVPGGRAPLRLSRPLLRVYRRPAARGRPGFGAGPGGGLPSGLRRLDVRASMPGAASTARWASPPSTACRWAPAPASSTPASSSICCRPRASTPGRIERFLYHDGGLKGLSGVSNDMRDLLASDDAGCGAGARLFRLSDRRARRARSAAAMGGIDGIVFTAGIGEHSPDIRAAGDRAAGLARRRARPRRQRAARRR